MNWAQPWWLLAAPLLLALGAVLVLASRRHHAALERVFRGAMLDRVLPPAVRRRRITRDIATLLGLGACMIALAEPRFDKQLQTIQARGTDLVIAIDLSRSMDAADVDPSRLERARREIGDLLAQLEGDRVGLVVFAGGAVARLPLTVDYRALQTVLGELRTDDFQAQGSDLGGAIRKSVELLSGDESKAGKAIIVFSDGEVFDPADVGVAAGAAADAHIPVYTVGVGSAPATIPLAERGGTFEFRGEVVTTTPDPATLQELARATGGAYVQSVASADDMTGLVSELRRSLASVLREQQQRETWRSGFQIPLGIAAALLLLAGWIGDGRRVMAILLGFLVLAPRPSQAADLAEADQAYRAGDYTTAVRELEELSLEQPDDPRVLERLGAARYRSGDFEGAARAYERAGHLKGGGDPQDLYNDGNARYKAGRLEEALSLYDRVLAADADHPGATANKALLEKELAARRAAKPPPPPQGGQGEKEQAKPGEGPPEPQQGEEQPGQEGEGEQDPTAPPQPGNGKPEPGDPSEEPSDAAGGDDPPDPNAEGTPTGEGPDSAPSGEPGTISAAQADRLIESVEEGSPGYSYTGPPGGKPW